MSIRCLCGVKSGLRSNQGLRVDNNSIITNTSINVNQKNPWHHSSLILITNTKIDKRNPLRLKILHTETSAMTTEATPPPASAEEKNNKGVRIDETDLCWCCKQHPVSYQPQSCDCAIYCKQCAMKFATGGVCKKCKKMYAGMEQMRR